MFDSIMSQWGIIATILFLVSELLAHNQAIKSNSVFGLIRGFLKGESLKAKPEVDKVLASPNTK